MKRAIRIGNKRFELDFGLVLLLVLMMASSCFALYNSFNLVKDGSGMGNLVKQVFWYCVGFAAMFVVAFMNRRVLYSFIGKAYKYLMWALIYLFFSRMLFLLSGGRYSLPLAPWINGAFSWFRFSAIGFQPSEFIKIVLIVQTAVLLNRFFTRYPNPDFKEEFRLLLQIGRIAVPPLLLILLQPDTGVCIVIGFTILMMILLSGIRVQYVAGIGLLVVLFLLVFFYMFQFHPDTLSSLLGYRFQRIEAWLDPESHILGSSNQLYTSLLSLGSAGFTGYGLQANIIAIPEAHTDFIFAAFGQCFGLVGTTFILAVCLLLDLYLCRMAYNMESRTDRYITIGVISMMLYQQFQNLGMIVGLVPITGVTLPLISYGGSSIVSYFLAFGLIMRASPRTNRPIQFPILNKMKRLKTQ